MKAARQGKNDSFSFSPFNRRLSGRILNLNLGDVTVFWSKCDGLGSCGGEEGGSEHYLLRFSWPGFWLVGVGVLSSDNVTLKSVRLLQSTVKCEKDPHADYLRKGHHK